MTTSFSFAMRQNLAVAVVALFTSAATLTPALAADPIKMGLIAALSGASAQSGEAITRRLTVAANEINESGGLFDGRKIEIVARDDQSKPPTGLIAERGLIFNEGAAAFFGGIDSPVSLAMVSLANQEKTPFIGVWAAATGIMQNGADPNYVFRVSVVDALVDVRLLDYANKKLGAKKIGLILINNPWGESNQKRLEAAVYQILTELRDNGTTILLVDQMARMALAIADRAYVMSSGAILASGRPEEVRNSPMLEKAYLGG